MKKIIKKYLLKINRLYLTRLPYGVVIINFIFQRIFRINGDVKYSVNYTSRINGFKNIILPDKNAESILTSFAVSGGCYIAVFENTTLHIGEGTLWAFHVSIQTGNHGLLDRNAYVYKSVVIGKNCWLGNSVTILAGVTLGDNVTVGANSVVTKSFPSNVVIAGCPAVVIKTLEH